MMDSWVEFPPKRYLTKETAKELLVAQEKMILDLEQRVQRACNQRDILTEELLFCKRMLIKLQKKENLA